MMQAARQAFIHNESSEKTNRTLTFKLEFREMIDTAQEIWCFIKKKRFIDQDGK